MRRPLLPRALQRRAQWLRAPGHRHRRGGNNHDPGAPTPGVGLRQTCVARRRQEPPIFAAGAYWPSQRTRNGRPSRISRPESPQQVVIDGTRLDAVQMLQFWAGALLSANKLSVSVGDDFHLKAQVDPLTTSTTEPPAALRAVFANVDATVPQRRYFAVLEQGHLRRLGVLPMPWTIVTGGDRYGSPARAELLIQFRRGARFRGAEDTSARGELQVGLSVDDPNVLAMLGYLKSGNVEGTSALLVQAEETLFDKVTNPFAAAAAGYILLQSYDPAASEQGPEWHRWISNLSQWYSDIPDGAIQRGWLDLQGVSSSESPGRPLEKARQRLLQAVDRGIPFYPQGIRLLLDGLNVITESDAEKPPELALAARTAAARNAARWLSLRTDTREVFTVLKL